MNLWLRYLIFGSGYGLPLRDTDTTWFILSGRAYHWLGGYGAQLISFEWFPPKVGDSRVLRGVTFRPFSVRRRWFLYEIGWNAAAFNGTTEFTNDAISTFRKKLGAL